MPFNRLCAAALLSLPLLSVPLIADAAGDDPVVLSLGHEQWTAAQFKRVVADTPPQVKEAALADPAAFARRYADMHLLAQLAESRRLDQDADVRQQLAWVREGVLANAARDDLYRRAQVSDEAAKRYYDAQALEHVLAALERRYGMSSTEFYSRHMADEPLDVLTGFHRHVWASFHRDALRMRSGGFAQHAEDVLALA